MTDTLVQEIQKKLDTLVVERDNAIMLRDDYKKAHAALAKSYDKLDACRWNLTVYADNLRVACAAFVLVIIIDCVLRLSTYANVYWAALSGAGNTLVVIGLLMLIRGPSNVRN